MAAHISQICLVLNFKETSCSVITGSKPIAADASINLSSIPTPKLPRYSLLFLLPPSGPSSLPTIPLLILALEFRSPSEQDRSLINFASCDYTFSLEGKRWCLKVSWKVVRCWFRKEEGESMGTDGEKEWEGSNWKLNGKLDEWGLMEVETQELKSRENCYIRKWMLISQFHPGPPVVFSLTSLCLVINILKPWGLQSSI